ATEAQLVEVSGEQAVVVNEASEGVAHIGALEGGVEARGDGVGGGQLQRAGDAGWAEALEPGADGRCAQHAPGAKRVNLWAQAGGDPGAGGDFIPGDK